MEVVAPVVTAVVTAVVTVVAGGWLEAPPHKTKRIKLLLEELGWLSKTATIRAALRHQPSDAANASPDATTAGTGAVYRYDHVNENTLL